MRPEIALQVNGVAAVGWSRVRLGSSLDDLADSFDAELVAPLSAGPPALRVQPHDEVVWTYDRVPILTGFVDTVNEKSSAEGWEVRIAGRSQTGDLVDCSAIGHIRRWSQKPVWQIAADLCKPFGVTVRPSLPTELASLVLDPGETVAEALGRLAATAGLRWVTHTDGSLEAWRWAPTPPVATLRRGEHFVETEMSYDGSQRYSDYIARATLPASDKAWGEAVAEVAEVRDLGVPRLRPLVLEGRQVRRRAEWERQTRAGKASRRRQAICIPDRVDRAWEAVPGMLWRPGQMVTIHDPWHGAGAWLLASVELSLDPSEGTVVLQELAHPEAYTPDLPPKPKKTESSW